MNYTEDIMKYKLLTAEEEQELAKRIAEGDQEALDQMICSNLRLVTTIANQYRHKNVDTDDLIQAGNVGLISAARKYKPGTNARFQTFAQYDIKHHIKDCLSKLSNALPMTIGTYGRTRQARKAMSELGEGCTNDEIARACGHKRMVDMSATLRGGGVRVSLDEKVDDDGRNTYFDIIEDDDQSAIPDETLHEEQMTMLFQSMDCLTAEERHVIGGLFGMNGEKKKVLREIGQELGKTAERIRQIKEKALGKLHDSIRRKMRQ